MKGDKGMKGDKSKSKSTKRSKIDKLIELKIELIKLLLVAAEIASEAEVEDMTPDELLGMMLIWLGGSVGDLVQGGFGNLALFERDFDPLGKRFLKDVAEDVDMDMDTVTDLLKEMLEDMI